MTRLCSQPPSPRRLDASSCRSPLVGGALATCGWAAILLGAASTSAAAPALVRGPYLQCAAPDSIVIVWRTAGMTEPRVRIGAAPDALDREIEPTKILVRTPGGAAAPLYREPVDEAAHRAAGDPDPSTPADVVQYEVRVEGLPSNATFYYAVYDGERRLAGGDAEHCLRTSPPVGSPADLRLWVVGDSGTGERDQRDAYAGMQRFVERTGRDLDLYLHVGDMAYGDGTDPEFQRNFFDVYQPTLRRVVCWPTMGNHEGHTSRGLTGVGPYYDAYVLPTAAEAGGMASGCEAYYSFDVANVHFVCLDSHDLDRGPTGAMAQWLVADLEHAQGDWLIAFWHHPPYTKGSHDSDREGQLVEMRENFMPLLEAHGVDLVLAGHSHIYERSMLIDGAYATPTTAEGVILDDGDGDPEGDGPYRKSAGRAPRQGTVAVVSGHGGAGLGRKGTMPVMREIILEHGSLVLDVRGDELTGLMVDRHGEVRDRFQVVKRGSVAPQAIADPWQPTHDSNQMTEVTIAWQGEKLGEAPRGWQTIGGGGAWRIEHVDVVARGRAPAQPGQSAAASAPPAPEETPRRITCAVAEAAADQPFVAVYEGFAGNLNELEGWLYFAPDAPAHSKAGVVLGYQDPQNFYAYVLDPAESAAELWQMRDGQVKMVTRRAVDLDFTRPLKVELEPLRSLIEVQLQDALEYTLNLDDRFPDGRVGVWVGPGSVARYALLTVERGQP